MFTIGDFAMHGRVSVRMLRHYDATGLLRPARVDPVSGYRFYEASQLARLNRLIALKDLGFTLDQVRSVLDEQVSAGQLRGMLRLRQAQLQARLAADASRLARVEARLAIIEKEGAMPAEEVQVKHIPAVRVAELTATAAALEPESITPVIQPLFRELGERLSRSGLRPAGPAIARYEDAPGGDGVLVHAGLPVSADPRDGYDFEITDLPELRRAATIVHRGSMDNVMATVQILARWIEDSGHRSAGYPREVSLECPGEPARWVTELQEAIAESD